MASLCSVYFICKCRLWCGGWSESGHLWRSKLLKRLVALSGRLWFRFKRLSLERFDSGITLRLSASAGSVKLAIQTCTSECNWLETPAGWKHTLLQVTNLENIPPTPSQKFVKRLNFKVNHILKEWHILLYLVSHVIYSLQQLKLESCIIFFPLPLHKITAI